VQEVVVSVEQAYVLTDKRALHLRAKLSFTDIYGVERKAGQEWLVTAAVADSHIPDVFEELVGQVDVTTLTNRQYCVVQDPVDEGKVPRLGTQEVRTNTSSSSTPASRSSAASRRCMCSASRRRCCSRRTRRSATARRARRASGGCCTGRASTSRRSR
jgi:major vault protein